MADLIDLIDQLAALADRAPQCAAYLDPDGRFRAALTRALKHDARAA